MSAYACEPGKGSEPAVGWNVAREMAKHHDVWVVTRANNREVIEAEIAKAPVSGLHFAYFDLPWWARWWKRAGRGVQLYYYLWQIGAYSIARRLHREIHFQVAHHVTLVKYWAPSLVALLPVPFVWGPVGGGESTPSPYLRDLGHRGALLERVRLVARWFGEHDPFVRLTAHRSRVAFATTRDTAQRMRELGTRSVEILSQVGVRSSDIMTPAPSTAAQRELVRFVSVGNLLPLKGFHLGLRAFKLASIPNSEYWIVGEGPYRRRLEKLARELGISGQVTFLGRLSHDAVLKTMATCAALVHPSLHDSGGFVCLEAMAAGKPVICLDHGGPALQVTEDTGFKIAPVSPQYTVHAIARAMDSLGRDKELALRLGQAGMQRARGEFSWEHKVEVLAHCYAQLARASA